MLLCLVCWLPGKYACAKSESRYGMYEFKSPMTASKKWSLVIRQLANKRDVSEVPSWDKCVPYLVESVKCLNLRFWHAI